MKSMIVKIQISVKERLRPKGPKFRATTISPYLSDFSSPQHHHRQSSTHQSSMASSATFYLSPSSTRLYHKTSHFSPSSTRLYYKPSHFSPSQTSLFRKPFIIKASAASVDFSAASVNKPLSPSKTGNWKWKYQEKSVNIYYEEHESESPEPCKNILMIPTISDVSTVEEWRVVAQDIVRKNGNVNCRATIVDWPGLGYSDRPKIDYNADVMEDFLVQFVNAPDSPLQRADGELVIFGGGHAATLALRAVKKGLVKTSVIAAVAPTWAGPLPIVFGRDSSMESRYGMLRGTLRAPAVGWMMYNMLVSNEKSITSQYKSHVYADPENVTPAIIDSRYALTKRKGSRYVPAAFLTGLLDPVKSREEFLELFAGVEGKTAVLVVSTIDGPKRSKAEMDALKGAKGVTKFIEVPGALLPQEEYPATVAQELYMFLQEHFESK